MSLIRRKNQGDAWETVVDADSVPTYYDDWLEHGSSVITAPNGATTYFPWDRFGDGNEALLDYSNPTHPTVVAGGIYAVTALVLGVGMLEGEFFRANIHLDQGDKDAVATSDSRAETAPASNPLLSLSCTAYVPEGGIISVDATLGPDIGHDQDFQLREVFVQRLS